MSKEKKRTAKQIQDRIESDLHFSVSDPEGNVIYDNGELTEFGKKRLREEDDKEEKNNEPDSPQ
jgi:hypothetical protein